MDEGQNKIADNAAIPRWFLVISVIALIWNLLGVGAFIAQMMLTPEDMAMMAEAEQALYKNTPQWAIAAFAFAVFGGAVGSLLLVLKTKYAMPVLIVSLIGVLVQMTHSFFISETFEVYGPGQMIMPILVVIIAFGLVWLARFAITNEWIK